VTEGRDGLYPFTIEGVPEGMAGAAMFGTEREVEGPEARIESLRMGSHNTGRNLR
jgi:hypothetical protein